MPAIWAEARRPWDELAQLVHTAEGVLETTMAQLSSADREAMTRFARAHLDTGEVDAASFVELIASAAGETPAAGQATATNPWAAALAADPTAAQAFARSWRVLAAARAARGLQLALHCRASCATLSGAEPSALLLTMTITSRPRLTAC